ncbi:MAG: hypothetical protein PHE83_17400 [Opitutaceae bacterium]|nr:hypothetical protein [Opitutaceae bacterium]
MKTTAARSRPLLIVVHPGSLCGSADMHLRGWAESTRDMIAHEISKWIGDVAVIVGFLDEELDRPQYAGLEEALRRATYRTFGEPLSESLRHAAGRIAEHFGLGKGDQVTVTGAWNDRDGTGCVTSVARALRRKAFDVRISPNAPASDAIE